MRDALSSNIDARPDGVPVDMLILHYTGMQSGQAAIDRLRDPAARVSSHYVVEEDGEVWRLVPEHLRAWHAGVSHWRGHTVLNDRSVGIEIVNPGHEWGYRAFPAVQMAAVRDLCRGILARHPIPARNVVGHSDVAPDRKQDPGELFDWAGLAAEGVGLWAGRGLTAVASALHGPLPGGKAAKAVFSDIGYGPGDLAITLMAFQRHWLPGNLSGQLDVPTWARLRAVRDVMA